MIAALSKTQSAKGARPATAVELTPEGALAASLPGRGSTAVYAFAPLPAGALKPGQAETNLAAPEAAAKAIATALNEVDPRSKTVTLIVPDLCARVFVLDFDSLPAKPAEAIPVIKFRLRKLLPFEAEPAGVSYQVLTESKDECRALIAVMPEPVLAEYEKAVTDAGYEPGAVLPAGLAALAALESSEPALIVCISSGALTTAITQGQDLLLFRTIELPADDAARLAEVQRDIAVATAFFEDKAGSRPTRLHFAGPAEAAAFANWLGDPTLEVVKLAARPETGAATTLGKLNFAGIAGALAGAA